jgi:hypothetical protein
VVLGNVTTTPFELLMSSAFPMLCSSESAAWHKASSDDRCDLRSDAADCDGEAIDSCETVELWPLPFKSALAFKPFS